MTKVENIETLLNLKNKKLLGVKYFDKKENYDDCFLELKFSDSYRLIIQTFWRILYKRRVIAMESERYLLTNYNAPKKNYKNLPFEKSLLCKNLKVVNKKILNALVEDIYINETNDVIINFDNSLTIQALISCRSNSYIYYRLFCGEQEVCKVSLDWSVI